MTIPNEYDDLLGKLDLEAKVALLTGADVFTMAGNADIELAPVNLSDGPTGVRGLKFAGGRPVALFPNATLLAAAWDTDGAYEVGRLLAEEAMAQDISVVLGPTINLHRSVLGGRLFEAYSEDPLLTGKIAAAYVQGLQASGVGACLKHLVANESETDRNSMNSVVDETTLRELYLLPFEIAIAESNPWSLMAAYNDINGVAATEQVHVNTEIVKDEWGYDGLIMSDWFATKTTAASANSGLDLVMPGPNGPWGDALVAAVRAGEVPESAIDDHVVRVLRLAKRVGRLGEQRAYPSDLPASDSDVRREQLTALAAAGMTVLTNDGTVPLPAEQTVALIGRLGVETTLMGGGSAQVNPPHQVSVAEGLSAVLGDRLTVTDGVPVRSRPAPAALPTEVEVYDAAGRLLDSRTANTAQTMVGFDDGLTNWAKVIFRTTTDLRGAVELGGIGVGRWTLTTGATAERFELAASGGIGAEMLAPPAQVVTAEVGADGRVEAMIERGPVTDNPLDGVGLFSVVLRPVEPALDVVLERARTAAAAADVAVVVVGTTAEQETEAVDKSTIALPGDQDALVTAVAGVAARTVVLINSGTPVLMPWLSQVDAVLWIGMPGQEGGHAVARVLTGASEATGRLVTSWPAADGAAPAWEVVPTNGDLAYTEGTAIGYRGHFASTGDAPAFWFGHGLGYSCWEYADARPVDGGLRVTVTNTGDRDSREVVQVYLDPSPDDQYADQPVRLVGWTAVTVPAGASAVVEVAVDARLWRRWDEATNGWGTPLSGGELLVARGLGDIRARLAAS